MALFLTILLPVLYSFQSLFLKFFSENYKCESPEQTSTVFSVCYGLFTGIVTLLLTGFRFTPSPATWLYGLLNAATLLVYNTAMINCSRTGSYSFQMIVNLFGGILVPLAANALLFGERLVWVQWLGIALILASVIVMNAGTLDMTRSHKSYFVWCAILFAANGLYSVWMNNQHMVAGDAERNEMIVLTFLGMGLMKLAMQCARDKGLNLKPYIMAKKPALFLLLCCAVAATAVHLCMYALSLIPATILYSTNNGGILVLSVLYSALFFGERLRPQQWIGVVMASAAVVLLSI